MVQHVKRSSFILKDQTVICIDSPVKHAFTFTPAISLFVDCDDEKGLQRLTSALLESDEALIPLGKYGFSRKFAWMNDHYGVPWQLNLP